MISFLSLSVQFEDLSLLIHSKNLGDDNSVNIPVETPFENLTIYTDSNQTITNDTINNMKNVVIDFIKNQNIEDNKYKLSEILEVFAINETNKLDKEIYNVSGEKENIIDNKNISNFSLLNIELKCDDSFVIPERLLCPLNRVEGVG